MCTLLQTDAEPATLLLLWSQGAATRLLSLQDMGTHSTNTTVDGPDLTFTKWGSVQTCPEQTSMGTSCCSQARTGPFTTASIAMFEHMPDLKQRLHMLNELGCAVVVAVGVDRMMPNHDLPLSLGPCQLALQLKQVALPGLLQHTA